MSDLTPTAIEVIAEYAKKLKEAHAEIERLSLDVKILSEELEFERRPKRDER
jgi:hypothetical protein